MNISIRPISAALHRGYSRDGSALLLTLWCVAILSVTILTIAQIVDRDVEVTTLQSHRLEARELALTGVSFGLNPEIKIGSAMFHQKLPNGAELSVEIHNEGARLNINRALRQPGRKFLKQLFALWEIPQDQASIAIDSLYDWTDRDDLRSLNGAEKADLETQSTYSLPQNRDFRSVREMEKVRGMRAVAEKKADWAEFFTVFGDGRLDLQDVSPDLMQAVANFTLPQAKQLVALRNGPDEKAHTKDDLIIENAASLTSKMGLSEAQKQALSENFGTQDKLIRITSEGTIGQTCYRITAVVNRSGAKKEFLLWEER